MKYKIIRNGYEIAQFLKESDRDFCFNAMYTHGIGNRNELEKTEEQENKLCKCGHDHIEVVGDLGKDSDEVGKDLIGECSKCDCENYEPNLESDKKTKEKCLREISESISFHNRTLGAKRNKPIRYKEKELMRNEVINHIKDLLQDLEEAEVN